VKRYKNWKLERRDNMTIKAADKNWYNLNSEVAKVIVTCTKRMIDEGNGYPYRFVIEDGDAHDSETPEGEQYYMDYWHDILQRIHDGFQSYLDDHWDIDTDAFNDAMALFVKYFDNLWD